MSYQRSSRRRGTASTCLFPINSFGKFKVLQSSCTWLETFKKVKKYQRLTIQGADEKRPPPPTKTAICQDSLDIVLRNSVRLFSRVDDIIPAHFIKFC